MGKKTIWILILAAVVLFVPVAAAASGFTAQLAADKAAFEANEPITAVLAISNGADHTAKDVTVTFETPTGYEPVPQQVLGNLAVGGSAQITVVWNPVATEPSETAPAETVIPESQPTVPPTTAPMADPSNPPTGDFGLIWLVGLSLSVFGGIFLLRNRDKFLLRAVALILCAGMMVSLPTAAQAAENGELSVEAAVTVAGQQLTLRAVITYTMDADDSDADGDGLTARDEAFLGTDPEKADTDGDTLTDGQEVLLGTNALLEDTDGNGLSDAHEDADGDGLTNGQEYAAGTDPLKPDTDFDGLSDYAEVTSAESPQRNMRLMSIRTKAVSGTDPLRSDTDGDGALDGWEVKNGYDPTVREQLFAVYQSVKNAAVKFP